jgi:hypothetical protein
MTCKMQAIQLDSYLAFLVVSILEAEVSILAAAESTFLAEESTFAAEVSTAVAVESLAASVEPELQAVAKATIAKANNTFFIMMFFSCVLMI